MFNGTIRFAERNLIFVGCNRADRNDSKHAISPTKIKPTILSIYYYFFHTFGITLRFSTVRYCLLHNYNCFWTVIARVWDPILISKFFHFFRSHVCLAYSVFDNKLVFGSYFAISNRFGWSANIMRPQM